MDIVTLKEICNNIENNTSVKLGFCDMCQKIVIDYHDSDVSECVTCQGYLCSDCYKYYKYNTGKCKFCNDI